MTTSSACSNCAAPRQVGHVICGYCRQAYDAETAAGAIRCPKCEVLSAAGQDKCVGCGAWIVVACVFCGAHSPHTKSACVACGEIFAGAAERKARRDAEQAAADAEEDDDEDEDEDDDEAWESGWAWCRKCQGMVYDADPAGRCAAGGKHDTSDSESYWLCTDPDEIDGKRGFRWCKGCEGLFHGPVRAGACPAGGTHDGTSEDEYVVASENDDDYDDDAGGWQPCKRCALVYWCETSAPCAAGGKHEPGGKLDYAIPYDDE